MNSRLRSAILATTALVGTMLVPGLVQAMEALRSPPKGADRWRLRPADVTTTGATVPQLKDRPVSEIPEERRSVRVVYPGLVADR